MTVSIIIYDETGTETVLCPLPGDGEEDDSSDVQSQGKQEYGDYYDSTPVTHMTPGVKEFLEKAFTKSIPKTKRRHLCKEYTPALTHQLH